MLTIFTPTYNRAYILPRLYESLIKQTDKRFEWVIVNDGSDDCTKKLIKKWIDENKILIKYYEQENQGKPSAHNKGVEFANGEIFTCVDSDDFLTDNAVEIINKKWQECKNEKNCIGIVGTRIKLDGHPVGTGIPNVERTTLHDLYNKHKYTGDTILIYKTEIIKKYQFPKVAREKFIPETYLYNQLDKEGKLATIKEGLYVCEYLEDGYTHNSTELIRNNPNGYVLAAEQELKNAKNIKEKIKASAKIVLGNWLAGNKKYIKKGMNKFLMIMSIPLAKIVYIKKYKKRSKKMRVGIVTLLGNNYGGTLQAYALNNVIKKEECDVEILNYNNYQTEISLKSIIKKIIYINRNNKFEKFKEKYMNLTDKIYDISKYGNKYDVYVAGSDQIWNQQIPFEQRKYFFLDFVKGKRKVAYAASVGRDTIEKSEIEKISNLLKKIDYISIREKTGVKLYQQLTSKKIENVLDPTLLLSKEEWNKIASTDIKEKEYVFSYTLGASKSILSKIDELSKRLNNEILEISYKKNFKNERKNINDAGPCEFISLVKNANYVLTNSFHGMVFSIIYEKQFLVFTRGNMNSRIYDLLNILGLEDRIIDIEKDSNEEIEKKLNNKICYDKVLKKLENEKEKSLEFLKRALGIEE